jgi:hypothetical protein
MTFISCVKGPILASLGKSHVSESSIPIASRFRDNHTATPNEERMLSWLVNTKRLRIWKETTLAYLSVTRYSLELLMEGMKFPSYNVWYRSQNYRSGSRG